MPEMGLKGSVAIVTGAGALDDGIGTGRGTTPFMVACASGNLDVVKLLLAHGANPKLATSDGQGPIILAVGSRSGVTRRAATRRAARHPLSPYRTARAPGTGTPARRPSISVPVTFQPCWRAFSRNSPSPHPASSSKRPRPSPSVRFRTRMRRHVQ